MLIFYVRSICVAGQWKEDLFEDLWKQNDEELATFWCSVLL